MLDRFTDRARKVMSMAKQEALDLHSNKVGTEHLLLALAKEDEGIAAEALRSLDISYDDIMDTLKEVQTTVPEPSEETEAAKLAFTPLVISVMERSFRVARENNQTYVSTEHLLIGIVEEGNGMAMNILMRLGVSSASIKKAIEKLTAAWNLRSFGELSDIPYNAIWDLSTQKSCAENIFQINYIQNNADLGSTWNYLFGPSKTGITSNKVGLMQNMTTKSVYDAFAKEDVRKNYLRETTVAGVTYYHTMKYADLECGANGYGGNNWIVMRYADVALMLAEAYYWQGTEPTAKSFLNMVRKRAGLGDWSGTDLRQGIYDERRNEFIQEGLRWQDLLRMYSKQEMIEHFNAINPNFGLKDLLLPIPYKERILNTEGLYQNPGYGVK